ncbi:MAG: DUF1275 domain-containing protein [Bdellovibrionales bacterium]|nr:DUF1275 domain-containing protein [Bdellovibrionales bacterium]
MYRLDRKEFLEPEKIALWTLLGFQAGFINAFGFFASGRYVSHVTGVGTQIGAALAAHHEEFAYELLGFPLFFISGAALNGVLTIARIEKKQRPHFDWVLALIAILLGAVVLGGNEGFFGQFGEELVGVRDFALLFLLTFICGLQNGCFAVMTKGQIRTTHLTGISTDIGTDAARLWFGKLDRQELKLTRKTNFSRVMTFLGFTMGSIISARFGVKFQFVAMLVPLASSILVFLWVRKISLYLDQRGY